MTEPTVTPPVAGASSVPDDVVEIALAASLEHEVLNPGDGAFARLRAAIAAARPHLTAERDAENTRLRAENEQLRRITAEVSRLRWLTDKDGPVVHALGQIEVMTARLEGVTDTARLLDFAEVEQVYRIAGDAIAVLADPAPEPAAEAPEPEIDETDPAYCPSALSSDDRHSSDYLKRGWACQWCGAEPVEADPAPSPPTAQETPDA